MNTLAQKRDKAGILTKHFPAADAVRKEYHAVRHTESHHVKEMPWQA